MKEQLPLFFRRIRKSLTFLIILFSSINVIAQTAQMAKIEGVVKDEQGVLPGASIKIKGTTIGTTSDSKGFFTLSAPADGILLISSIGYKPTELSVKDYKPSSGSIYRVFLTMTSEDNNLNELVVVGFGTQKKVNVTGSVGVVDAKELENRPVQNITQALEGLIPGLNIGQSNGALDTQADINIRGQGTISTASNASPLILVDGMEGSLSALNPQDVESISVLKDASSSAVYGSRAAFGVILVTTKKGKAGKIQINYNDSFRSSSPTLLPKMMDSYTFALYFNDASTNGGNSAIFGADQLARIQAFQAGTLKASIIPNPSNTQYWGDGYAYGNANNDWFKIMYRDHSFSQEHNLSLNGGTDKTTYYISTNYLDQNGIMTYNQDTYARYGVSAKINNKISDQLSINYSTRFLRENFQRPSDLTTGFYGNLGRQGWPTLPLTDPNGYLYSSPSPALAMAEGGVDNTVTDWMYQQMQLVYEPIKGWKTFAEFNYRTKDTFRHWDAQQTYNHDVNGVPYLYGKSSNVYEYGFKENYFNTNIYSEYTKSFGKHNFKAMVGFQNETTKYRDLSAQRNGIILADIPTINTTSGTDANGLVLAPSVTGQYQNWATAGYFGRINYDYDGRYLLEANLRYDGSSRFRADNRWGTFPSISAGWNVAREDFWKNNLDLISTLKIRGSYGSLGNQNTKDWYPTYVTIPVGTANGGWLLNGSQPNTASSPPVLSSTQTWETVKTYNAGLDFGLFKNRLTGSLDVYDRKTLNMLGPAIELPLTFGTAVPVTNNTDLKTRGFELDIAWNDRTKGGLGYGFKFLLSDAKTTVTRYPNLTGSLNTYLAGDQLGNIYGYTTLGIAKTQAQMDAHLATSSNGQSVFGSQWGAGDIMYADYNHDGKIDWGSWTKGDSGDAHVIGNNTPRYRVGFDMHFEYKGFDFRAFLQGVLKRDYWISNYYFWGATSSQWFSTGLVQNLNYFRNDPTSPLGVNTDSYYPRPVFGSDKNQQVQTGYLQNAAYLRIKNLQLGYTLPSLLTKHLGGQKFRIYASAENLVTWTKLAKMFDPETVDGGDDQSVYPLNKVFSVGLSVTF